MDASGHGRHLSVGQCDRTGRGRGSSSSPPRGLREAYARIVDEENLAAAESPLPDEATEDHEEDGVSIDWSGRHLLFPHDHRHEDHLQAEHARALASPRPLRFPVRPSGQAERHRHQPNLTDGDHRPELDDSTVGSSSLSGSTVSGLSSLENGTDDSFVRTLAKHRRDQRRVKGALTNGQPVFSRAHHGDANGLTSENLHRRDKLDRILVAEKEAADDVASLASNRSDPAIHLPTGWARKSRRRREWLRQTGIHSDDDDGRRPHGTSQEVEQPGPAREEEPSHENDLSAIDRLAAGADTPLPSVEAPSSTDRTALPSGSNPSRSIRQPALSAERAPRPDSDPDFTARSLVTSTSPIIRAKLTVLERIREREIEALKGQALTRNRLDQIRERTSPEPLRSRRSSEQADDEQRRDDVRDDEPRRSRPASPKSERATSTSARGEGANHGSSSSVRSAPDQAQADSPPADTAPRQANEAPDVEHPPGVGQPARGEADRTRTDSRDLLRQLARAASNSPSPTLEAAPPAPAEAEGDGPSAKRPVVSDPKQRDVDDDDDDESGIDDVLGDLTPRAEKGPIGVVTPAMAVGGWLDTPARALQAIHHPLSSPSLSSSDPDVRRDLSKLKVRDLLGRHDISSLVHERREGQPPPPQNDHERARADQTSHMLPPSKTISSRDDMEIDLTMDSLDRLIADETLDFTASNLVSDAQKAALMDRGRSNDQPANGIDGDGQMDKVAYDRMNRRLQTLLLSVRNAKHGIDLLEDQVGRTDDHSVWACPECGHLVALCSRRPSYRRPWYLRFRIPFLTVYRRTSDGKHLLTWFGLIWLTIWGYLLAESLTWYVSYVSFIVFAPTNHPPPFLHSISLFFCRKGSWEDDPFGYVAPRLPFAIFGTFRWYLPWIANPFGAYMCRNFAVVNYLFPNRCDWLTWPIDWPIHHTVTTTTTTAATEAVFTSTTIISEGSFLDDEFVAVL